MNAIRCFLALLLVCLPSSVAASTYVPVHVSLKSDAAPIVGRVGTVTATATVDRDLPDLTVEIFLPTEGKIVGSSRLTVASASDTTPIELKAKIAFSTPGLKFVRAVVRSTEMPGVVWSAAAYLLLDVGQTSSSVITDTRAIRTAPEFAGKSDGQRRGRPTAEEAAVASVLPSGSVDSCESALTQSSEPRQPLSSTDLIVTGKWSFKDRAGNPVGQKNAFVELRRTGLFSVVLATTYTDWQGNFAFPAITNPGVSIYVRCYTLSHSPGNAVSVKPDSSSPYYSSDTDAFLFTQNDTQSIGDWCVEDTDPNIGAWWIVDDMAIGYSTPPNSTGGHHAIWTPTSTHGSHYHPGGEIHLEGPDCETPDVPLHEMGHSVQYNIYGDYLPNVGGPHSLFGRSSPELAWIEGWATAWMMWVTDDPVFDFPGGGTVNMETPTWGDGRDEGYDVEGRVAGALWDIADSADDGYDTYTGGWLNIWEIMYDHNCDTFWQFWQQWMAHAFNKHGPVKCLYQNTINWNTPPVFGGLPDITVAEDVFLANAMDLDDYASDQESLDHQLIFGIVNVSTPSLQIGIDAHHRVNLQGVLNWHGTATVEIWCTDGLTTVGDTFIVTVTAVNDPPLIQGLPDLTLDEDTSLSQAINLSKRTTDPETASHLLSYSITGNTNPSCGVSIVSSYYVSVNPVANWFGISDVTIRATDPQGLWSEDTFRITVNPVNDPPVIQGLPDRALDEDTSLINTIDLWAYTTDLEIPSSALSYYVQSSALPAGTVTISSNRYINITPPANYYGSGNVTIRVWDWEQGYDDDTFFVTVRPVDDPPAMDVGDHTYPVAIRQTTRSIDLHQYASDADGPASELTFTVTGNTNPSLGAAIGSNRYLRITQPAGYSGHSQITVRATDPTGLWVESTLDVAVGWWCENCSQAFSFPDNSYVIFPAKPVTWSHYYAFYIQDPSRASGIRVNATAAMPEINRNVTVGGRLTTYEGERAVDCLALTLGDTATEPPAPLFMAHRAMGGIWPGSHTPDVPTGKPGGLYNVGLLVRTTGTVVSRNLNSFWIADGSGVHYSFANKGLYVDCQPIAMYAPTIGSRVTVTGISGATTLLNGNTANALRLRSRADVKGLGGKVAYIYNSAVSTAQGYAAFLGEQGWNTTTIPLSVLTSRNLSVYDVLIIGADTGTWTNASRVIHVINSDRPVIAMGDGGARFLDQVPNLYIGWLNSAVAPHSQGYVSDLSSDIYWWERIISVPTHRTLTTLTTAANTTMLYSPPQNVYGLLRHPTDNRYWMISREGRYMQWGYDALPSNMSEIGENLLVNCLYYMQGK